MSRKTEEEILEELHSTRIFSPSVLRQYFGEDGVKDFDKYQDKLERRLKKRKKLFDPEKPAKTDPPVFDVSGSVNQE